MASDGSLIFDTKVDDSGFSAGVGNLGSIFKDGLGVLTGNLMTKAVGAVKDLGASVVNTGKDFDTAMSQIAATMGTTVDAIPELTAKAQELGKSTAFSATEAAEGLNILAMSGLSVEQQLSDIEPVLNLAAAGSLDLASAASFTEGAIKGFADESKDAQYYTDLMAKGATLANTNVEGLGESLSRSAATAKSYGQNAESVTVALLRLAEQNVTGEAAATALNRAMADMYTPTKNGAAALAELGVSAYNADGSARELNDVVADLDNALSGMSDEEKNAYKNAIFTAQGLQAFNKMTASSTEKVQEFKDGLSTASDGIGSAAQQAETMLDNLEGKLTILGSAAEGLQLALYNGMSGGMVGMVEFATDAITQLTDGLNEDGTKGMAKAATNIVISLINGLIDNLPSIVEGAGEIITGIGEAIMESAPELEESGLKLLNFLYEGLIGGLDLLLNLGVDLLNKIIEGISGDHSELIASGGDLILEFTDSLLTSATYLLEVGMTLLQNLLDGIGENMPALIETGTTVITGLINQFSEHLPELLTFGFEIITNILNGIINNLPNLISSGFQIITTLATNLLNGLPTILQIGSKMLLSLIQGIINNFPQIISAGAQGVARFISSIGSALPSVLNAGINILTQLAAGIIRMIPQLPTAALQAINAFKNAFSGIDWGSIGMNIIRGVASGITNGIGIIVSAATDAAKSAFQAAKNFLGIKSPSRKFYWLGQMSTEGYTNAIDDSKTNVSTKVSKLIGYASKNLSRSAVRKAYTDAQSVSTIAGSASGSITGATDYKALSKAFQKGAEAMKQKAVYLNGREIDRAMNNNREAVPA